MWFHTGDPSWIVSPDVAMYELLTDSSTGLGDLSRSVGEALGLDFRTPPIENVTREGQQLLSDGAALARELAPPPAPGNVEGPPLSAIERAEVGRRPAGRGADDRPAAASGRRRIQL